MTSVWAKTRPYFRERTDEEIEVTPCFKCGAPASAEFTVCAIGNRWAGLCKGCHRATIRTLQAFIGELDGRRSRNRGDVLMAYVVAAYKPEDVCCDRCGAARAQAWWTMFKGRGTVLCWPCDVAANTIALRALDIADSARRLRKYRARITATFGYEFGGAAVSSPEASDE